MNKQTMYNKVKRRIGCFAINVFLLFFSIMNILPVLWMIMSSIKTENDYRVNILSFPREIRLMNYFDVFIGSKIYYYMLNSFINVLVVVPISLFFVFVTGYLLSRYKFFGRNLIYGLFMLGVFLPMHVILVPIYLEFSWLNMLDKRYTLWIPLIAFSLSMSIFIVESFIRTIPRSIEEAAFIDGASFHYSMSRIMAPMCTPALSTSLILIFIGVWNEFALSYTLLQKNTYRTISYAIRLFESTNTTTLTLQLTALVLASIPVIILYIAFSDQIISGMVAGAVKG